jgi:CDP-diacylglycerol--glycerol-3-phosphate 3-phosphatidyltransferase
VISERIGIWIRQYMLHVGRFFARLGMTPNMATVIGLSLNVLVAVVIGFGQPLLGGVFLLVASAFDMVDGAIARSTGSVSKFGGFLDSTLDRYSEVVVYVGVLVWLNRTSDDHLGSLLVLIATSGALMVSYARARAEEIGYKASVGLVARPERVVLLALALIINQPLWALWILAVATHVTAVMRILHVWKLASVDEKRQMTPADE